MAKKPGRPPRSAASTIDATDPVDVLRSIAGDVSAPASARVAAARALLALDNQPIAKPVDETTERALRLLAGGRR
jgi:hypothetical protein